MKKSWVIVAVTIITITTIYLYLSKIRDNTPDSTYGPSSPIPSSESNDTINLMNEDQKANDLVIENLEVGTGSEATSGKTVTVNYKGTLKNGVQFDSSYDRGEPFSFSLGAGEVIKGWEVGIVGMKEGGKRKLTIAPSLGYADRAVGLIPANSTLIFDVELLKVE